MSPANLPIDQLGINTIRALSIDAILAANSGHPGLPLGAAPMAYTLWTRFLKHNPANPAWPNRDRFVLSAGHGSMLLYSLLHLTGYDLPLEELKRFRQWGSRTPGHPEYGHTPGVETTTGPLGQGFAFAVGMAIAERHLAARFNKGDLQLVDHYTYTLAGDGCLMEGVAAEAASLAGHLKLGKLICLYDSNDISLAASTSLSFTEDAGMRFRAYGWQVLHVQDGNDVQALGQAIATAQAAADQPSLIVVHTHIGFASPKQDTYHVHGSPLSADEVAATKKNLGYPSLEPFHLPEEAVAHFRQALEQGRKREQAWKRLLKEYGKKYPELKAEWDLLQAGKLPAGWDKDIPRFSAKDKAAATRATGGQVLNAIAAHLPQLVGGSADLNPSTNTVIKGGGDFQSPLHQPADRQGATGGAWGYNGRNIHFGVREHAMGAVLCGLALHGGTIPYGATFFTFADYLRPSLRLAAMMGLHVIFVFTHDSIGVGEDGPTHQPVEHLASLRAIPGLVTLRPADANETAQAWRFAVAHRGGPVALVLSRQALPVIEAEGNVAQGARVVAGAEVEKPDVLLIGSGSEVSLALQARELLAKEGVTARVVSLSSWELFEKQTKKFRRSILPPAVKARVAVEAGVPLGWAEYAGPRGAVLAIRGRFGASAPAGLVFENYGFTAQEIARQALAQLRRPAAVEKVIE